MRASGVADIVRMACEIARGAAVEVLVLPPFSQLRTGLEVPLSRDSDVKSYVEKAATRLFRAADGGLVTDASWIRTPQGRRLIAVAAPHRLVSAVCEAIEMSGCRVRSVRPDCAQTAGTNLSLVPPTSRRKASDLRMSRVARVVRVAAVLAPIALVLGMATGVARHRATLTALASLRPAADSAITMRRRLGELRSAMAALDRRSDRLGLLDQVSQELPRGAFLSTLAMNDEEVVLGGLAEDPAALVGALRRVPGWTNVEFVRPAIEQATVGNRKLVRVEIRLLRDAVRAE